MTSVLQRKDKNAFNALFNKNLQCKEQYLVPIAWHVLHDARGKGNVSVTKLEDQVKVLNSTNLDSSINIFLDFLCLTSLLAFFEELQVDARKNRESHT